MNLSAKEQKRTRVMCIGRYRQEPEPREKGEAGVSVQKLSDLLWVGQARLC